MTSTSSTGSFSQTPTFTIPSTRSEFKYTKWIGSLTHPNPITPTRTSIPVYVSAERGRIPFLMMILFVSVDWKRNSPSRQNGLKSGSFSWVSNFFPLEELPHALLYSRQIFLFPRLTVSYKMVILEAIETRSFFLRTALRAFWSNSSLRLCFLSIWKH